MYMCTQCINFFTGVTKEMQYINYSDRKRKHGTRRKREGREKATRKIWNSKRTEKKGWRNGQQGSTQKEKVNMVKLDQKQTSVSNTTEILWCFYTFDRHLLNVLIHIYMCDVVHRSHNPDMDYGRCGITCTVYLSYIPVLVHGFKIVPRFQMMWIICRTV